jgi:hypothetical protein
MSYLEARDNVVISAVRTIRGLSWGRLNLMREPLLPLSALAVVAVLAVAYVGFVLWPRWPEPAVPPNAPALPIMVGEVTFNIPPGAIRAKIQRKPGVQERVDLAFLWPSLTPAGRAKLLPRAPAAEHADPKPLARVFVTITASNGALSPLERFKTIYPRYAAKEPAPTSTGLMVLRFRDGTPYQGEDLIYEAAEPERFFLRCTRDAPGRIPGTCLAERRMRDADIIVRFPRGWLADWRAMSNGIDRLIGHLKPH